MQLINLWKRTQDLAVKFIIENTADFVFRATAIEFDLSLEEGSALYKGIHLIDINDRASFFIVPEEAMISELNLGGLVLCPNDDRAGEEGYITFARKQLDRCLPPEDEAFILYIRHQEYEQIARESCSLYLEYFKRNDEIHLPDGWFEEYALVKITRERIITHPQFRRTISQKLGTWWDLTGKAEREILYNGLMCTRRKIEN